MLFDFIHQPSIINRLYPFHFLLPFFLRNIGATTFIYHDSTTFCHFMCSIKIEIKP